MAMTVHCDIVSAEEELFSGLVEMVVAHGNMGDLGILPGHTPLLTDLKPGPVRVIKQDGNEEIFYISGGFIEIQPSMVKVLADTAVRAGDIDEAAAEEAKTAAEKALSEKGAEFDRVSRYEAARTSGKSMEEAVEEVGARILTLDAFTEQGFHANGSQINAPPQIFETAWRLPEGGIKLTTGVCA